MIHMLWQTKRFGVSVWLSALLNVTIPRLTNNFFCIYWNQPYVISNIAIFQILDKGSDIFKNNLKVTCLFLAYFIRAGLMECNDSDFIMKVKYIFRDNTINSYNNLEHRCIKKLPAWWINSVV